MCNRMPENPNISEGCFQNYNITTRNIIISNIVLFVSNINIELQIFNGSLELFNFLFYLFQDFKLDSFKTIVLQIK